MKIACVRFREGCKTYDFDATGLELAAGDRVIVDTDRGLGIAYVVRLRHVEEQAAPEQPANAKEGAAEDEARQETAVLQPSCIEAARQIRRIVRKAAEEDVAKDKKNMELEAEAFKICQELIMEREMPMKLIGAEYAFDGSRVTFYFFSETRVDFRELVKELAHKLKSRIEMRQIGVRDVARQIGGFGTCGKELCCVSYLRNFEPVSIRMAKKQEMVLNPAKISGVCGRLLCCLSYEYEMYDEIKKDVAGLREAAVRGKAEEEERRLADERKAAEAEARRVAEDRKRHEERRQQERRDRQKETGQKEAARQGEKKKDAQNDKRPQAQGEQPMDKQQPKQAEQQPQADGEKGGKKGRRRFWRRRKRHKQQEGQGKTPGSN